MKYLLVVFSILVPYVLYAQDYLDDYEGFEVLGIEPDPFWIFEDHLIYQVSCLSENEAWLICPTYWIIENSDNSVPVKINGGKYYGVKNVPESVYSEPYEDYFKVVGANGIRRNWITSLTLPGTIENINTIEECKFLERLYFNDGMKEISGVRDCPALSECRLPRTLVKIGNDSFNNLTVLPEIELPNSLYELGDNSFNYCDNLRKIVFPSNNLVLYNNFNFCPSIKEIWIPSNDPLVFPDNCFNEVDRSNCALYVPESNLEYYKNTEGWENFEMIRPLDTKNSIFDVRSSSLPYRISIDKGMVNINCDNNETITIYNVNGMIVDRMVNESGHAFPLPKGFYLISNGDYTTKVTIK